MKIAIIGSRGIPNKYGGFEQFAEIVSALWVDMGHQVICYNPNNHGFEGQFLSGVEIKNIYCPENIFGASAHFLYDYLSLRDATINECDIFLQLGYQSSAPSFLLFNKKIRSRIVTNMDGMEWKRTKWSFFVKFITKISEKIAVKFSGNLISDNQGIADYILERYGVTSDVIAYGCYPIDYVDENASLEWLSTADSYDLVIARLEPENNVHNIIKGFIQSGTDRKLIIVGGLSTKYAKEMLHTFGCHKQVVFVGGIYDHKKINSLRQNCTLYFHGHSVGGTNPSLIEAMANRCRIIAHDNVFNRAVLGLDGLYFASSSDLKDIIKNSSKLISELDLFSVSNLEKVMSGYRWDDIANKYIDNFHMVISK